MFEGLSVAMVTPFKGGVIDWDATARLLEHMIEGGVEGLIVSGSTGEAATCSVEERRALWTFVKQRVQGRVWLVAGTGSNATAESITLTRMAEDVGMDGAMMVTPYYNKPTPKGQIAHFTAVAQVHAAAARCSTTSPAAPARTRMPEVLEQVQDLPNVVAVKEASGSLDQASAVRAKHHPDAALGRRLADAADDRGGCGRASFPSPATSRRARCGISRDAARAGRMAEAEGMHRRLVPLFKALFVESNPGPVKFLLSAMGLIENELRLPLVPVEPATQETMLEAARGLGLAMASGARA